MDNLALKIANYLSKYQDDEGIIDPVEKRIIKNGYGTVFYSLLCALSYKKNNQKIWRDRAVKTLKAELNNINSRHDLKDVFRWEFKNYALITIYSLIGEELEQELKGNVKSAIFCWNNLGSFQTNWIAMRALNYRLRYLKFGRLRDLLRAKYELSLVLSRQSKEGFFWDDIRQDSSQYHAYTLALLYQYYVVTRDLKVKRAVEKGTDFIVDYIDENGDFNLYGRGKKQVFGYVSLIFVLCALGKIKDRRYFSLAKKVFDYVKDYYKKDFPIVMDSDERMHLYKYNNRSAYLSFTGVYLLYSSMLYEDEKIEVGVIGKKKLDVSSNLRFLFYYPLKFVHFSLLFLYKLFFQPKELFLMLKYLGIVRGYKISS